MNIQDLVNRNLIKQCSDFNGINNLPNDAKFYVGFDPTNSLHVGHLLPIITMKRLQNAGARPIAIIGGATARVGDPTNRSDSRPILSEDEINSNKQNVISTIKSIVDCEIVDNSDFVKVNFVDFVFDIGKHFSVNQMLTMDTYKTKLKTGLSFLEFSYALLQANDFLQLSKQGCLLQIGGNDQWSNMLAGIHLIHAKEHKQAFCLTLPILEDKNGVKFGKSAGNAVWLDKDKTSVFDFWQFWRNVSDDMVSQLIDFFTFSKPDFDVNENINKAKEFIANEITTIVHGPELAKAARDKATKMFSSDMACDLDPTYVETGKMVSEILQIVGATSSKSEGLRLIKGNGSKLTVFWWKKISLPQETLSSKKVRKINLK